MDNASIGLLMTQALTETKDALTQLIEIYGINALYAERSPGVEISTGPLPEIEMLSSKHPNGHAANITAILQLIRIQSIALVNLAEQVANLEQAIESLKHEQRAFDHGRCTDNVCHADEFVDSQTKRSGAKS
jgi:hypothetical protein